MVLVIDSRLGKAARGITVLAAEQAGIIHADVLAGDAAAGFALVGVLLRVHWQVERPLDQLVVDTFSGVDTERVQIQSLGAALDLYAVFAGYFCHGRQNFDQARPALLPAITDLEALFSEILQALPQFWVQGDQADLAGARVPSQCLSDPGKRSQVKLNAGGLGQQDGIVAPNDPLGTDLVGEHLEGLERCFKGWALSIDGPWVVQHSDQEIITVSFSVQVTKVGHQGARIASPENDPIDVFWAQRYRGNHGSIIGVRDSTITCSDAVTEPRGIESRDIGSPAGANDHRIRSISKRLFSVKGLNR